jgi:RNA polymerase sigma-70 factor, ECF subfamily
VPDTALEIHELHKFSDRDEEAFRRLVVGQREALHSHCHRMLGTPHDAEDAFQETMLRAWRGLPSYQGRSSLRTWLHRIATNVCIDAIERRHKRVSGQKEAGEPTREPVWIEYEQREALELAFITALQHLPARQLAVFVLRDVLGFTAKEVAVILETTVAATNSAQQRARAALDERLPQQSEQATLRSLGDARARDAAERLLDAFDRGDIGAILLLLAMQLGGERQGGPY